MEDRRGPFAFNSTFEVENLSRAFASSHRVQIHNFLSSAEAEGLQTGLAARADWRHVINGEKQVFETSAEQMSVMPSAERALLDQAIFAAATDGFQFRYDTIRVADEEAQRLASATALDQFALFMNSAKALQFFRRISGQDDICFADAQATRYRAGDFLTRHDDNVPGKDRALAYVLSLSRHWKAEWGGLLLFNDPDGGIAEAVVPRFNSLTVFAVGQPHSVSYVAPYAGEPRLSITGWLRTTAPK
jgi:SM-20-related protein